MKEILLTSSVLILALLALRRVFRRTISRRVQYALWSLVLVRLLVPASLPAMEHSLLTAVEPVNQSLSRQLEQQEVYVFPTGRESLENYIHTPDVQPGDELLPPTSTGYLVVQEDGETVTRYADKLTVGQALACIWYAGIAFMGCWLIFSNLRFWHKLRKGRVLYSVSGCKYPVYLCENLPSPCLFGLFRPAIYLTPAAVSSPQSLRHVLAHEETHARHLDPLWSALRCVCLAVYWFNPLVWIAAMASKTDCELACDEGALRRLGNEERLAYGQTLLSLIPVVRKPSNPMLSATTMTAGKRQLKDRITRIAENRQTAAAALFAAAAVAALVCAVTFTGAKPSGTDTPLTGTELKYFNEEFFNGENYNIRNQFLSSLYERPEDINLFDLFYCGVPNEETFNGSNTSSDEELRLVYGDDLPDCARYKASTADLDALLTRYTGLTVAETNGVGLEGFTYLADYDAYYWAHGDTNYRAAVTIASGERKDGLVCLYYQDDFMGEGWKCVSLRETETGYQFVSNQLCGKPAVPTSFPSWDPVLTIPLTGLDPYQVLDVPTELHTGDNAEILNNWLVDSHHLACYRAADGNVYVAVLPQPDSGIWRAECFLTLPYETCSLSGFDDLFGRSGAVISYSGRLDAQTYTTFHDYYAFTESGAPLLLARAHGMASQILDLDGDGANELISEDNQLFFQRDGQVYEADITALMKAEWPEMSWWDYSLLNTSYRCLTVTGMMDTPDGLGGSYFERYVFFDGENLLVYKDERPTVDHVLEGVDAPAPVIAAAKTQVLEHYNWWQQHTGVQGYIDNQWQEIGEPADWDDWHITGLNPLFDGYISARRPGLQVEVYGLGYELHTTTPEKVAVAGGMYIREGGWVGGFNNESWCLIFQVEDGQYTQVESLIASDEGTGSPFFRSSLARSLMKSGILLPSEIDATDLYYMFCNNQTTFLNELGTYDRYEQSSALQSLAAFADSGAAGEDSNLFAYSLQNLEWNSSGLTEEGRLAYELLLAWVDGTAVLTEPALESAVASAMETHMRQVMPADYWVTAHELLAQQIQGDTATVYLLALYSGGSGSPAITERGMPLIRCYSFLPAALTFRQESNHRYVLEEYWEPSPETYGTDLRARFPADLAEELMPDLSQHFDQLSVPEPYNSELFQNGPIWPVYVFSDEITDEMLCRLVSYYGDQDIYTAPVRNELAARFSRAPEALMSALEALDPEEQASVLELLAV